MSKEIKIKLDRQDSIPKALRDPENYVSPTRRQSLITSPLKLNEDRKDGIWRDPHSASVFGDNLYSASSTAPRVRAYYPLNNLIKPVTINQLTHCCTLSIISSIYIFKVKPQLTVYSHSPT